MVSFSWLSLDIFALLSVGFLIRKKLLTKRTVPYPPGPPESSWLTGNLSDLPQACQWIRFTQWAEQYGGIVHFRALQSHTIIVNSLEVADDLFEKRSYLYSGRPPFPMMSLMDGYFCTSILPYGATWRTHRRFFQQAFKPDALPKYRELQNRKLNDLLYGFLNDPQKFLRHIRTETGAVMLSAVYDYDVAPEGDHLVEVAQTIAQNLTAGLLPGTFLVNMFPFLRHVPDWFPGAAFKQFAQETKALVGQLLDEPLQQVQRRMASGEARHCLASELLETCQSETDFTNLRDVCGFGYLAGADTTGSTLETFIYAMSSFNDIQLKAQEEIDKVVGKERFPTLDDRPSLPYVEALFRETMRWMPVLPLAIPHYTIEDDIYKGYYIPKGTMVLANTWAISHDATIYDEPERFYPSRFFNEDGQLNYDDVSYTFGYGRRKCPGRYLASATLWLNMAVILAAFSIRKKKDSLGNDISLTTGFSVSSLEVHPNPFECTITPRSDKAKALVLDRISQHD